MAFYGEKETDRFAEPGAGGAAKIRDCKYEIAEELGLLNKVMSDGWKSLSAKETGRIGGLMTKKRKEMKEKLQKELAQEESLLEELL